MGKHHEQKHKCTRDDFLDDKIGHLATIESDLVFWTRAISQYQHLLFLGLVDNNLKSEARKLHEIWERFRGSFPRHCPLFKGSKWHLKKLNCVLLPATKAFQLKLLRLLTCPETCPEVLPDPLDDESLALKEGMVGLGAGKTLRTKWIGWIYPSVIEHMTRELNYATAVINDVKLSRKCEIGFWKLINEEHALILAKLLDPSEWALVETAYLLAKEISKCHHSHHGDLSLKPIEQLYKYAQSLRCLLGAGRLRSIIPPFQLEGIIREIQRSVCTLRKLKHKKCHHVCDKGCDCDNLFDDFSGVECNKGCKVPTPVHVKDDHCHKDELCCELKVTLACVQDCVDKIQNVPCPKDLCVKDCEERVKCPKIKKVEFVADCESSSSSSCSSSSSSCHSSSSSSSCDLSSFDCHSSSSSCSSSSSSSCDSSSSSSYEILVCKKCKKDKKKCKCGHKSKHHGKKHHKKHHGKKHHGKHHKGGCKTCH